MDSYDSLFSRASHDADEAPLDLIFAQHCLQKLNLVSQQNLGSMCDHIAHKLDVAEEALTCAGCNRCADKYLPQIAEARKLLHTVNG